MYLSGYLKRHQREYYRLLSAVRIDGDWEAWILEAVADRGPFSRARHRRHRQPGGRRPPRAC